MFVARGVRVIRRHHRGQVYASIVAANSGQVLPRVANLARPPRRRAFHNTHHLRVVKPMFLADIGEGIVECEIIQWFVEPDARVEEFSPLCEVQSDKASVEITSRFAGVVKKLYYDAGQMAKVGKPFVDIDIQDAKQEDIEALTAGEESSTPSRETVSESRLQPEPREMKTPPPWQQQSAKLAALATPAVRHVSHKLGVAITDVLGTGKDGRVLKEDVFQFVAERDRKASQHQERQAPKWPSATPLATGTSQQQEIPLALTKVQETMFKIMTHSLAIPHFLYADEVDFTSLVGLRARLNRALTKSTLSNPSFGNVERLSYLPFIIKAVSMALYKYPILNACIDTSSQPDSSRKPFLVLRSQHNVGVAMDTPFGLLVPVIRDVGNRSVLGIAAELVRLHEAARKGKLLSQDMVGGTITVSNIGSIGGTYLSPVLVEREVAILGIGRVRRVPSFASQDENDQRVVSKCICNFSWTADHRVVDGATLARAAEVVRGLVEEPEGMVMLLQ